jgi:hypothetical protein
LSRAREDAKKAERKARQQLNAFLLRHGLHYCGKSYWSLAHWRWISDIKMEHEAQQFTLQEYVDTVRSCSERVELDPFSAALRLVHRVVQQRAK